LTYMSIKSNIVNARGYIGPEWPDQLASCY